MKKKTVDKTNPKDALGSAKLPLALWPTTATAIGSLGILEGLTKYGYVNWRATPVKASVYIDALQRHVAAFIEGEDNDPITKVPHLGNALACIAIIHDAKVHGTLIDDRPMSNKGYRTMVEELTPIVTSLRELNKSKHPRHFTIKDSKG